MNEVSVTRQKLHYNTHVLDLPRMTQFLFLYLPLPDQIDTSILNLPLSYLIKILLILQYPTKYHPFLRIHNNYWTQKNDQLRLIATTSCLCNSCAKLEDKCLQSLIVFEIFFFLRITKAKQVANYNIKNIVRSTTRKWLIIFHIEIPIILLLLLPSYFTNFLYSTKKWRKSLKSNRPC